MQPEIEALITSAHQSLSAGEADEALRIADVLSERQHSSGFTLGAMALDALGRTPEAITRLETGLQLVPEVWLLWNLLGNLRSDTGDYQGARVAYHHALDCPNVTPQAVRLNLAILEGRLGNLEAALEAIDGVGETGESEFRVHVACTRARLLRRCGKVDDLESLVVATTPCFDEAEGQMVADLHVELARARQTTGGDALGAVWAALGHDCTHEAALGLLRTLEARPTTTPQYVRLVLEGVWHSPFEGIVPGFYVTFTAIADSGDDAVALATRLLPEAVRPSLTVVDCELEEEDEGEVAGVIFMGPYAFFPQEE